MKKARKMLIMVCVLLALTIVLNGCGGHGSNVHGTTVSNTNAGGAVNTTMKVSGTQIVSGHQNKVYASYDSRTRKVTGANPQDLCVYEVGEKSLVYKDEKKSTITGYYKNGSTITISNCYIIVGGHYKQYGKLDIKVQNVSTGDAVVYFYAE